MWPVEVKAVEDAESSQRLRIITANVLASNRNAHALLDLIDARPPDIVVALESDQWWEDQLDILEPQMSHSIKCPLDNLYGMHVYSRLPLESVQEGLDADRSDRDRARAKANDRGVSASRVARPEH